VIDLKEYAILETRCKHILKAYMPMEGLKQKTVLTEEETFGWLHRLLVLSTINSRSLTECL
jgi:hypothetical protein